jgi:predicted Zn-dependent protease with MMP-like domain
VRPVDPLEEDRFADLVADALDSLPDDLLALVENVAVVVEDAHPTEDLLGCYEGVPLTERSEYGFGELPDRISLYRLPICELAADEAEVVAEVRITVVHEIAHHFGIDDDALHELGWD